MYKDFYNLNYDPFNLTIDSSFTFETKIFSDAFLNIMYGIERMNGIVAVTGKVGTGKTTLCHFVADNLRKKNSNYLISMTDSFLLENKIANIYRFIHKAVFVSELKLLKNELDENSNKLLHVAFRNLLTDLAKRDKKTVIIIDEADKLTVKMLQNLSLLSNMESKNKKLIQIVLIGEPCLLDKLKLPELEQLNQRIYVRYKLQELDIKETEEYIHHRMKVAGSNSTITFPQKTIRAVYKYTKGCQRLINLVCDRALLQGMIEKTAVIKQPMIDMAIKNLAIDNKPGYSGIGFFAMLQSKLFSNSKSSNVRTEKYAFIAEWLFKTNNLYKAATLLVIFFLLGIFVGSDIKTKSKENKLYAASIPATPDKYISPMVFKNDVIKKDKKKKEILPFSKETKLEAIKESLPIADKENNKITTEEIVLVKVRVGRIREFPFLKADILAKAEAGTMLQKIKVKNGWSKVQIPDSNEYGWIKNSIISLNPQEHIKDLLTPVANIEVFPEEEPFEIPTEANKNTNEENNIFVVARRARIRNFPSINSEILTLVDYGTILDKVDVDGNWSKIRIPDNENMYGWINNSIVKEQ